MNSRQKRYWRRKLNQQCVDCEAGLPDDAESVRCVECTASHVKSQTKHLRTAHGRERDNKRIGAKRERWRVDGLCVRCGGDRDAGLVCRACLDRMKLARSGIPTIGKRLPTKRAPIGRELIEYQPLDEAVQSHRVRILRALWWRDWSETREIFQAAGIEDDYWSRDRNSAQVTLGRLVRYGLVERRVTDKPQNADYRITAAGRAEVARYRAGDLKLRVRRAA